MKLPGGWSAPARAARMAVTLGAQSVGRPELGHALPDFLVVGAMKAGTTFLFAALTAHPHVIRSRRREIHFFGSKFGRGVPWYRRHFPTGIELKRYRAITGEGSTSYLANPESPARIRDVIPKAKMIALLRDPVDRAISNYFHEQRTRRETLPIVEAFAAEEERLRQAPPGSGEGQGYLAYRRRGLYADQLQRYYDLFPREQLLVLRSETFFAAPQQTLDRVYGFLGVDPAVGARDFTPRNVGDYDASQVPASLAEELARFYAPHNERLYRMLGEDWRWRRP